MSAKVMLYKVSLEGHMDVMAFLGEQDARTFSQILFAGPGEYRISQAPADVAGLKYDYPWAVSNDSEETTYDIVFFKEKKMRNIFVMTLMYALAGKSIESFTDDDTKEQLDELGMELDRLGTDQIPLSWIKTQAMNLSTIAMV